MLRLIAYDIADPRRLRRVAIACEDFGIRVQKSLFECWLEEDRFNSLWDRLVSLIDPETDFLAAYVLEAPSAARRRAAGRHSPTNRRLTLIF
jgi:CRISPR-associated protein Cas2